MGSLTYNEKTKDYVFIAHNADDDEKAAQTGLTLSKTARAQNGNHVYFTQVPYAALTFWDVADERAKTKLRSLHKDFVASNALTSDRMYSAPNGHAYMPYQHGGISYGLDHNNILIGDEPGLGKTAQSIGIANETKAERNLVICPASIRLNWQREVRKWSKIPKVKTYPVLKSGHGVSPDANYVIMSYELVRNEGIHDALYSMHWDNIILDEAHYLKTPEASRTRAIFGGGKGQFSERILAERADRLIALTGTPLPNRPREAYTLARALNWESIDWMSYDAFCMRFNPSGRLETGAVIEKRGRLPELQHRLRCNFMVRRQKKDVLTDLPDKRYELSYIEPNGKIREVLAKERLIGFNISDLKNPFSEIWGEIATVRKEMGIAKIPRIVEHMRYLLDIEELPKVVMFSHHREVMDQLAILLAEYGVVQVRGGMGALAKQQAIDDFVNDPRVRIFSGQLDAAGFGIDGLQNVCQRAVFSEPAWTPGTNEQAADRIHRIGQHQNVLAQFLVVEGSFDERVLAAVLNKAHTIHDSLDRINF